MTDWFVDLDQTPPGHHLYTILLGWECDCGLCDGHQHLLTEEIDVVAPAYSRWEQILEAADALHPADPEGRWGAGIAGAYQPGYTVREIVDQSSGTWVDSTAIQQ